MWALHGLPIWAAHMGCPYDAICFFANGIHVGPMWASHISLKWGLYGFHMCPIRVPIHMRVDLILH